ncbi:hypothetical protein UG55_102214 [Frankia sp. EI5c]|nr:hypothetical protein UG55_102214 [Frankia sp. EI5c]
MTIGALFLSMAVVITYTLLPLPGQRSVGDLNYLAAGLLFFGHIVISRLLRTRLARRATMRATAGPPPHPGGQRGHAPAHDVQPSGPDRPDALAE